MGMLVGVLSAENLTRFISFKGYVQHKVKIGIITEVDSDSKKPLSTEIETFIRVLVLQKNKQMPEPLIDMSIYCQIFAISLNMLEYSNIVCLVLS